MMEVKISIDKITLVGRLHHKNMDLPFWLSQVKLMKTHKLKEYPKTSAINTYRYAYTIETPRGDTFYLAFCWNGGYKDSHIETECFKVEFNPNKSAYGVWREFANYFNPIIKKISKFDIACDIPGAKINDVYITTKAEQMHYVGDGAVTLYIAPKEKQSGRVKIYDKTIEQAKAVKTIPQTLRVEATAKIQEEYGTELKSEQLEKINRHLQDITIYPSTYDDTTLEMLLYMPPFKREAIYKLMAKATRAKYRKLVREQDIEHKLPTITNDMLSELLKEYQTMATFDYQNEAWEVYRTRLYSNKITNQVITNYNDIEEAITPVSTLHLSERTKTHERRNVSNESNISCNN